MGVLREEEIHNRHRVIDPLASSGEHPYSCVPLACKRCIINMLQAVKMNAYYQTWGYFL